MSSSRSAEALDIRVVQRRIDLVEHADRGGVAAEHGEDERERGERLLAAREQRERGELLAGRLRVDLEPGHQRVVRADQSEMRAAAAEHAGEQRLEVPVHLLEDLRQALAPLAVEMADRAAQLGDRGRELLALGVEAGEPRLDLLRLDLGAEIDRPHLVALLLQPLELAPGLLLRLLRQLGGRLGEGGIDAEAFEDALGDLAPFAVGLRRTGFGADGLLARGGERPLGGARGAVGLGGMRRLAMESASAARR